jgi:hypothetical protein
MYEYEYIHIKKEVSLPHPVLLQIANKLGVSNKKKLFAKKKNTWNGFCLNYHAVYTCVCFLITVIYFFMLFVSGNAVLLALSTALHHLYKDFRQQCNVSGFLKPMNYLCVFIAVETAVLAYVIVTYVCKLHSVNVIEILTN